EDVRPRRPARRVRRCATATGCNDQDRGHNHPEATKPIESRQPVRAISHYHLASVSRSASNSTRDASALAAIGTCSASPCIDAATSAEMTPGKILSDSLINSNTAAAAVHAAVLLPTTL